MARNKFISKFMAMMTNLIVLILVEEQANDLIPTSFHSSSFPILVYFPSKLDNVQELLYYCLESNIKRCSNTIKKQRVRHAICVTRSYRSCLLKHMENIVDEPGPVYKKAFEGYEYRVQKHKHALKRGDCLHAWFKWNIKKN